MPPPDRLSPCLALRLLIHRAPAAAVPVAQPVGGAALGPLVPSRRALARREQSRVQLGVLAPRVDPHRRPAALLLALAVLRPGLAVRVLAPAVRLRVPAVRVLAQVAQVQGPALGVHRLIVRHLIVRHRVAHRQGRPQVGQVQAAPRLVDPVPDVRHRVLAPAARELPVRLQGRPAAVLMIAPLVEPVQVAVSDPIIRAGPTARRSKHPRAGEVSPAVAPVLRPVSGS